MTGYNQRRRNGRETLCQPGVQSQNTEELGITTLEYAEFIGMLRDNLKAGMGTAEAIDAAIKSSLEQGILTRCKTEVYGMLLTEYDEKKVMEDLRREAAEIAAEEERRKSEEERKRYKALLAEKEAENEAAFRKIMILQKQLDELAGAGRGQGN